MTRDEDAKTQGVWGEMSSLFCCFIDFSSALQHKLLQSNINGKILTVITNMYNDIKSCVSLLGNNSAFFSSFSGARQGENVSPILFSLYLNDPENHIMHDLNTGIERDCADYNMAIYLRLIVLLYADDKVILASNEHDLQRALNDFDAYCKSWKRNVNIDKTKVVIFGAGKTDSFRFKLGDDIVEITDKYKYLSKVKLV